jgi:hypothetical protein
MRPIQHDSYVAGIDDEARAELVRKVLQDRRAQLVSWREEPMGGGGSGSELYSISGEATSSGTVLPWKFILKMFNHEGEGWQEGSTDPTRSTHFRSPSVIKICFPVTPHPRRRRCGADGCDRLGVLRLSGPARRSGAAARGLAGVL